MHEICIYDFATKIIACICDTWNSHRIRNTNTTDATIRPAGRQSCTCSTEFFELAELTNILMNENNLNEPTNAQEGLISNQTSNFC